MKPLSPLSSAARAMLEVGGRVEPPSAEQSARMARTLAPLFESAGDAQSGSAPQAPRGPASASRLLLGGSGKLLLAVGALAASNGASFWFGRLSTHVEPAALQVALAAPVVAAPMLPAALPAVPLPREPAAPPPASTAPETARTLPPARSPRLTIARRAPPPPRADGLSADIQRLSRADARLREGKASEALRLLAPPVVRELREQAAALRAVAGCQEAASRAARGGIAAAERDARAMLERFPESPYEARVRSAGDRRPEQ